jgi:hypothetical protein
LDAKAKCPTGGCWYCEEFLAMMGVPAIIDSPEKIGRGGKEIYTTNPSGYDIEGAANIFKGGKDVYKF